jgi:O-glycosyl hydrolase
VRRAWARTMLAAGLLVGCVSVPASASSGSSQAITVNGAGTGRVFDGVGAISGGGGTSRLLVDYPEPERSRILDYLFKPGYGASLQILKVEIGSDTNSSNGAEPSIMRSRTDLDCNRGYEWWLMEQAKKRNPSMKFYGLEWGAPGWFQGGFWSQDNITYLLNWLGCARQHGLTISYLGGWNERGYDMTWFEELRAALDKHGYGDVQVVAADNAGWQVAADMTNNPAFNAAVNVVGVHYPCSATNCSSSADAIALNKPLFASESGWNNYLTGADRLAAEMNLEYIDSRITAFINWPAVYAWYPSVQMQGSGLLEANQPWSGHYELGPTLWTIAQTAQFTRPGWSYIDSASGMLDGGGSYVTLRSPQDSRTRQYSMVLETTAATAPQTVTVSVAGGLPTGTLHVWSTQLESTDPSTWFVHDPRDDLRPSGDGTYTITLQPDRVYTLTTMTGGKGAANSPPSATMRLPYTETFDGYRVGSTPRYFSDMEGAFQVEPCVARPGTCLEQVITTEPIKWARVPSPVTLVGDTGWTNYTVSTKTLLEQPGTVSLLGRVVNELSSTKAPHLNIWMGYYLNVTDTGDWSVTVVNADGTTTTLANGSVPALGTGTWHTLALRFHGDQITPLIDGTPVGSVTDSTYGSGQAGLMLGSYSNAQFDDFSITRSLRSMR